MKNKLMNWKQCGKDYSIDLSIGGYYRLICDGVVVIEDSACEDCYELESAMYLFIDYITEKHLEYDKNGRMVEDASSLELIAERDVLFNSIK